MKPIVLAVLSIAVLSGCAAKLVSSSPRNVLVDNVRKSNAASALEIAEKECQKYDKHAVYVPDNTPDGLATYQCVD